MRKPAGLLAALAVIAAGLMGVVPAHAGLGGCGLYAANYQYAGYIGGGDCIVTGANEMAMTSDGNNLNYGFVVPDGKWRISVGHPSDTGQTIVVASELGSAPFGSFPTIANRRYYIRVEGTGTGGMSQP